MNRIDKSILTRIDLLQEEISRKDARIAELHRALRPLLQRVDALICTKGWPKSGPEISNQLENARLALVGMEHEIDVLGNPPLEWAMRGKVAIFCMGERQVHAVGHNGNYATLCGLDGDDLVVGQQTTADVQPRERIDCPQCLEIWEAARKYRQNDFMRRKGEGDGK